MLDQLGNALMLGSVVALASIGFSLIHGVTKLFNFMHAEFLVWGAALVTIFHSGPPSGLILLVLVILALGALVGAGLERAIFRPLRGAQLPMGTAMIVTMGMAFILRYSLLIFLGPTAIALELPRQVKHEYWILILTQAEAIVLILATCVTAILLVVLLTTRLGTEIRATSDNATLAAASGINPRRVALITWMAGVGLAMLAGVFITVSRPVSWNMGLDLLILIFCGVIVGGLGTAFGALIGGYAIGILTQLAVAIPTIAANSELKSAVALAVLMLVLLFRPDGLVGRKTRVA